MSTRHALFEVKVENANLLDERLNTAVAAMQIIAMGSRTQGIKVTRLRPGHYTVALSDAVPFGVTREYQEQNQNPQQLAGTPIAAVTSGWSRKPSARPRR
jgi:hypothetical protein